MNHTDWIGKSMLEAWLQDLQWVNFKLDDFDDNMNEDTWTLYNHLFVTRNDKVLLAKFVNKAYDSLKDTAHFKALAMDEQGELCVFVAKMEIKKLKAEDEKIKEIEKKYS